MNTFLFRFSFLRALWLILFVGFISAISGDFLSSAADSEEKNQLPNFEYHTVTTPEGLVFRVPQDMPIEKRGGIVAPIPFDEYTYRKFKKVEDRMKRLESRLQRAEKEIESLKKEKSKPIS